ncbi:hypothetical protein GCM10028798_00700 [Humibacter antri]
MAKLDVDSDRFEDKLSGCWTGKNCGGTLGTPLERQHGQRELFDVWWYPELPDEGGMPNDDLELQLVWLKALEEVGPGLNARDLGRYWLDHVGYNFDEYGLSKTNLRLGLYPPASGFHNNWFRDCMGCPIRSEIWACVAPGHPRIAARYAYMDAICDHAGGESVYGELFNVAIESAAFVVGDVPKLLEIGLSYVPEDTQTYAAIRAAMTAHAAGVSWQSARNLVLEATPHYNAQYSPINMGFQVIGLLYGTDFGDSLCKAVNCGYDTDCTGATLGSYLGILSGARALPERWTKPLGGAIATNESWGGVRHLSDGPNPAPQTIAELVARIRVQARRVLAFHGVLDNASSTTVCEEDLFADAEIMALVRQPATRVDYGGDDIAVAIDCDDPVVVPGVRKHITTVLTNRAADPVALDVALSTPPGWSAGESVTTTIEPGASAELKLSVDVPKAIHVENSNRLFLAMISPGRPQASSAPVVLVGARAVRVSDAYPLPSEVEDLLNATAGPESTDLADPLEENSRTGTWATEYAMGDALPIPSTPTPAFRYLQTFLRAPSAMKVWMGVDATCPVKLWVNNRPTFSDTKSEPIRHDYRGDKSTYVTTELNEGWNEILIKLVATAGTPECHFLVSSPDALHSGLPQLEWTRFPWDR